MAAGAIPPACRDPLRWREWSGIEPWRDGGMARFKGLQASEDGIPVSPVNHGDIVA